MPLRLQPQRLDERYSPDWHNSEASSLLTGQINKLTLSKIL